MIANSKTASTTHPSSITPGPHITSLAPLEPDSIEHSGLRSGAKAGIALGIILLVGALALGTLLILRKRRISNLPRGIQPVVPFDNNAQAEDEHADATLYDKPYIGGLSSPAKEFQGSRKDNAGTTYTVNIQEVQALKPEDWPESHAPGSYSLQMAPEQQTREASPRFGLVSREFITPTNTNVEAPAPYVWTRGRTLSRDIVEVPAK